MVMLVSCWCMKTNLERCNGIGRRNKESKNSFNYPGKVKHELARIGCSGREVNSALQYTALQEELPWCSNNRNAGKSHATVKNSYLKWYFWWLWNELHNLGASVRSASVVQWVELCELWRLRIIVSYKEVRSMPSPTLCIPPWSTSFLQIFSYKKGWAVPLAKIIASNQVSFQRAKSL